MDFKLFELEQLFGDIKDILDYIDNSKFDSRWFTLYLANGEIINYKLFKDHIPHLLGIDITALISTGFYKQQSSYEVLKELIDNPYRLHKLCSEGRIKYDNIFSPFIFEKIKVFNSNISPNIYETEFVCKYKSDRAYTVSSIPANYDYIIVKKIRDTETYSCLCLINNGKYMTAMSSTYFETKEDLENYLKEYIVNQEITVLNGVRTVGNNGDYNRTFNLKPEFIVPKLDVMIEYKDKFNCIIDTTGDYKFSLNETIKHMERSYDNNTLLVELVNYINEGKVVDRDKFSDSNLIVLVDAYNNYLCANSGINIEIMESYSEIHNERKTLREELEKLRIQLIEVTEEKDRVKHECARLTDENNAYKANEETIIKILRPNE